METLQKCLLVLTIIGAINWGFVGLLDINLVTSLFGSGFITRTIYTLVAVAGIVNIGILFNHIREAE